MTICYMLRLLSIGWSLCRREIISGDEMKEMIVNAVFALRDVCGKRYLSGSFKRIAAAFVGKKSIVKNCSIFTDFLYG